MNDNRICRCPRKQFAECACPGSVVSTLPIERHGCLGPVAFLFPPPCSAWMVTSTRRMFPSGGAEQTRPRVMSCGRFCFPMEMTCNEYDRA